MNTLPEDIQNTIYKYKHQLEFVNVMNDFSDIVDFWCDEQLYFRYCKNRHTTIVNKCKHDFKCLDDYEDHLCIVLKSKDILDIINDNYDVMNNEI